MYASVTELRSEGVLESAASDSRLVMRIEEATATIDRATGWWFEPRSAMFQLDGRGAPSLWLPVPPLRLDRVAVDDEALSADELVVVGAPILPGFDGPRLSLRTGVFPRGTGNVLLEGLWGFTEADGTPLGRTPLAIRRACMLLVLRSLAPLADESAFEASQRARIIEEKTRDQSYRLQPIETRAAQLTGDPEIDALLEPYRRPMAMGAV